MDLLRCKLRLDNTVSNPLAPFPRKEGGIRDSQPIRFSCAFKEIRRKSHLTSPFLFREGGLRGLGFRERMEMGIPITILTTPIRCQMENKFGEPWLTIMARKENTKDGIVLLSSTVAGFRNCILSTKASVRYRQSDRSRGERRGACSQCGGDRDGGARVEMRRVAQARGAAMVIDTGNVGSPRQALRANPGLQSRHPRLRRHRRHRCAFRRIGGGDVISR